MGIVWEALRKPLQAMELSCIRPRPALSRLRPATYQTVGDEVLKQARAR